MYSEQKQETMDKTEAKKQSAPQAQEVPQAEAPPATFLSKGYEPTKRNEGLSRLEAARIRSAFMRSAGTGKDEHSRVIEAVNKEREDRHQYDNTQGQNNLQFKDTQAFQADQEAGKQKFAREEAETKYQRELDDRNYKEDTDWSGDLERVYDPSAGPLDWAEVAAGGDQNKAMNIAFDALDPAVQKETVNNIIKELTAEGLVSPNEIKKVMSGELGFGDSAKVLLNVVLMKAVGDIKDPSLKSQALNEMKRQIYSSKMGEKGKAKLKRLAMAKIPEGATERYFKKNDIDRESAKSIPKEPEQTAQAPEQTAQAPQQTKGVTNTASGKNVKARSSSKAPQQTKGVTNTASTAFDPKKAGAAYDGNKAADRREAFFQKLNNFFGIGNTQGVDNTNIGKAMGPGK